MAKKTVMVVDDEPDIRESVKKILSKEGYAVVSAENCDDCMQKLRKQKVDLILLDVMMPGMPVKEMVPKIKGAKIAFLTVVHVSDAEREELLAFKNIAGLIQKPFDIKELVEKVRGMIG